MKQCPICQKKFPDSEEFCPVHGVKLEEFKNSTAKAWVAAGAGILSWCLCWYTWWDVEFSSFFIMAVLSVTAVILPRGSAGTFPKWCAYITGYLMMPVLLWLIFDNWYYWF